MCECLVAYMVVGIVCERILRHNEQNATECQRIM